MLVGSNILAGVIGGIVALIIYAQIHRYATSRSVEGHLNRFQRFLRVVFVPFTIQKTRATMHPNEAGKKWLREAYPEWYRQNDVQ